jgi:Fe-S cluster assembly protein SufD
MMQLCPGTYQVSRSGCYFVCQAGRYVITILSAQGQDIIVTIVAMVRGGDQVELVLKQEHEYSDSSSTSTICGIVYDDARLAVSSLLSIGSQAYRTTAYQGSNILLIGSRASAQPAVEIGNDQVSCRHASAIGSLDEECMKYLYTKGLDNGQARDLLIESLLIRHEVNMAMIPDRQYLDVEN